jgi:transketolase C-terminal domain/subunit
MRDGLDVALLSTGNILPEAVGACRLLENRDIDVGHWHFPWVVPVDGTVLEEVLSRYSLVVTVEEHSIEGGSDPWPLNGLPKGRIEMRAC